MGLADATGSAEDPSGLDIQELLRLFHGALPIASFDPSKLSGMVTSPARGACLLKLPMDLSP